MNVKMLRFPPYFFSLRPLYTYLFLHHSTHIFTQYRVAQKKRNSRLIFFRTLLKKWTIKLNWIELNQQLSFFTLLDRASFPRYNNTKIIKFGWELFILLSNFLWTVIFGICHYFVINRACLGTLEIGQIPKMTVHKKLPIKLKVLNQIWWSWCYYNEKKMLYPTR